MPLTREELVLAVLSTSDGEPWNPSQLQKVFFILDQKVAGDTGGPHWNFLPFAYGPLDPRVFRILEAYEKSLVIIQRDSLIQSYLLSVKGHRQGGEELKKLPESTQDYIRKLSAWVRECSFIQLVAAIRKEFPGMVTWKPEKTI